MAFSKDPIAPPAANAAIVATMLILGAALVGATIRLLPWVLDPSIAWSTLAPFAKSLLAVAFEAALLIGWPVGWALATQRLVERGEARVLASLGERPARTICRLIPQGIALGAVLLLSSAVLGREAVAPGRIVNSLIVEGRRSCTPGATNGIPFVAATWLCPQDASPPRLVGRAPLGGVIFTAQNASVSDDLRRIDLVDARVSLPSPSGAVAIHVDTLALRGLAPWARASALPPALRAIIVTVSAFVGGWVAALAILRATRRRVGGVAAAAIGGAGPLAALATLRALELRVPQQASTVWLFLFSLVPVAALAGVVLLGAFVTALPETRRTDTK